NKIRDDVQAFPGPLQDQFWSFIHQCTSMVAEVDDPTYFDTQIYRVTGCHELTRLGVPSVGARALRDRGILPRGKNWFDIRSVTALSAAYTIGVDSRRET